MGKKDNRLSKDDKPYDEVPKKMKNSVTELANKSISNESQVQTLNESEFDTQKEKLKILITEKFKVEEKEITKGRITKKEVILKGQNKFVAFGKWINRFSIPVFILYILMICGFNFGIIFFQWFLGAWSSGQYEEYNREKILIWSVVITFGVSFLSSVVYSGGSFLAGTRIYVALLKTIMKRPMSFFDATPIGSVLTRLIVDKESVDTEIGYFIQQFAFGIIQLVAIIVIVGFATPFMLIVFLVVIILFVMNQRRTMQLQMSLKKVAEAAKAPMYSNISEAFSGAVLIKSYQIEEKTRRDFELNMDTMLCSNLHLDLSETYNFFVSEQLSALLALFTAFTIALMRIANIEGVLDKNRMGLALSYTIVITGWVTMNIFAMSKFLRGLISFERITEWTENKDLEAEKEKKGDPKFNEWPKSGKIEAINLTARYRKELPRVLKGLTFTILHKQKVGVVGRTGSGKSTLILSLLRILEQDGKEHEDEITSEIRIDGKNIGKLGLNVARRAVTLIPQEPFLMSGTVRTNIDPFKQFSDAQIIEVLNSTNLYDSLLHSSRVLSEEGKTQVVVKKNKKQVLSDDQQILDFIISSEGSNLSIGQRQLICIARALISKPKILLMDEATAHIDNKTDQIIQKVLTTQFQGSTILTIAHRLRTIIGYDKIMFIEEGKIEEFEDPYLLLQNQESKFYRLVIEGGQNFYDEMLEFAKEGYETRHKNLI